MNKPRSWDFVCVWDRCYFFLGSLPWWFSLQLLPLPSVHIQHGRAHNKKYLEEKNADSSALQQHTKGWRIGCILAQVLKNMASPANQGLAEDRRYVGSFGMLKICTLDFSSLRHLAKSLSCGWKTFTLSIGGWYGSMKGDESSHEKKVLGHIDKDSYVRNYWAPTTSVIYSRLAQSSCPREHSKPGPTPPTQIPTSMRLQFGKNSRRDQWGSCLLCICFGDLDVHFRNQLPSSLYCPRALQTPFFRYPVPVSGSCCFSAMTVGWSEEGEE